MKQEHKWTLVTRSYTVFNYHYSFNHNFGFVSWSVTLRINTESGAGTLSTSVSFMKEEAMARTLPSGLKAREAMLVGYLNGKYNCIKKDHRIKVSIIAYIESWKKKNTPNKQETVYTLIHRVFFLWIVFDNFL